MKSHYKLSSKPIGPGSYVVIVDGLQSGEVHQVQKKLNGVVWTTHNNGLEQAHYTFLERRFNWNAPTMLPIQAELPHVPS